MPNTFDRRRFLQAGGAVAGASLLGSQLSNGHAAAATGVPETAMFNIHAPSSPFIPSPFSLASTTVMQSFAFDNVNERIYTVQLTSGGTLGELTCTKLDYAGKEAEPSWLHLKGFGHGVQIGAQRDLDSAYIWVETLTSASGFGTQIARFRFEDFAHGATLSPTTTGVEIYKPRPTYGSKSIAVDSAYNRASLRYRLDSNTARFDLFDLDSFASHSYTALCSVTLDDTTSFPGSPKPTFQGHTSHGSYLYLLTGTHDTDNMMIWAFDWNTGKLADSFLTEAGKSLSWREPEGMAVWQSASGTYHLTFGIATGATGARKAAIFYK
jgi:receptor-binding protein